VSDTGPGMSADQRAHLFTPGFTTKAHGSGLGLTIVQRIVSDHDGAIHVEAGAPRGTTVVIELPRSRRTGHADAAPR
jgi:signal transduction histidine kinase